MTRHYKDWLSAYMDYASVGEAPKHMHFWSGVSAIAGALRRKVWLSQGHFTWYPNFYICLVAPPGVVSKSTTAGISMKLLRKVPGIRFGPDVVTWPALVEAFADSTEAFEYKGEFLPMSPLTLESSEFGNLLDPQDKQMVDLLVSLWDGKEGSFEKKTKSSGNDSIQNPWINLIACTTPSWIAGNFPEYMIGGGFTSRTIFIYAEKKAKLIAYPGDHLPVDFEQQSERLAADLTHIATKLCGPFTLTPEAKAWGTEWYRRHNTTAPPDLDTTSFGGYIARKQTHVHKLAMVLAASAGDDLIITEELLKTAYLMVSDLEPDMKFVFSKIGRSDNYSYAEKLVKYVHSKGAVPYMEAFRFIHSHFPAMRDYEEVLRGCIAAGYIRLEQRNGVQHLVAGTPLESARELA